MPILLTPESIEREAIYSNARRMIFKYGYWISLYQCLTLQYWCNRNNDEDGVRFWQAIYSLIKRDWAIRI